MTPKENSIKKLKVLFKLDSVLFEPDSVTQPLDATLFQVHLLAQIKLKVFLKSFFEVSCHPNKT
jgi:hypothetical protein